MSTSPSKKGIWKQIEPWISREKYFGTTISILIGVFFIYHGFSRDSINSDKDLYEVTGTLNEYSFEESDSFRRNNIYYYLWLTEYSNRFQIKADFANYFNRRKFEQLASTGTTIKLLIPKQRVKELNTGENIYVMAIKTKSSTFMNSYYTIREEKNNYDIELGLGFLAAGILFYLFKRYW